MDTITIRDAADAINDMVADQQRLRDELEMIRMAACAPAIAHYGDDGCGGGSGGVSDPVGSAVGRIDTIERRIADIQDRIDRARMQLVSDIAAVTNNSQSRLMVCARYVCGQSYGHIGRIYGYSPDYVRNLCVRLGRCRVPNNVMRMLR